MPEGYFDDATVEALTALRETSSGHGTGYT